MQFACSTQHESGAAMVRLCGWLCLHLRAVTLVSAWSGSQTWQAHVFTCKALCFWCTLCGGRVAQVSTVWQLVNA
jgi:hypothetical protein